MNRTCSSIYIIICTTLFLQQVQAQTDSSRYTGLRIGLFNFQIREQNAQSLALSCSVANTGRKEVAYGKKNEPFPSGMVIEMDSLSVPHILKGLEYLISDAIKTYPLHLKPGVVRSKITLDIQYTSPVEPHPGEKQLLDQKCPDLVFDTAFVAMYNVQDITIRYVIRNKGNAPAYLLGSSDSNKDNMMLSVYFVRQNVLTRGAIPAGSAFVEKGVDTLDGVLRPGQRLTGSIKISLKKRSRLFPNLIVEIDPTLRVKECDRANNTTPIIMAY
jgi:hypothetical protein